MFVFDSDKLKHLIQELKEKLVLQTDFNNLEKIETSATEPNNDEISIWINTSEDTLIDKLARINDNIMSSDVTWSSLKISNEYATKEDVQTAIDNLELDNQEIDLSEYAKKTDVPTNISELNNDEEFITIEDVPTNISELNNDRGFITITSIPTKVSQLLNDSEFTTIDNVPVSVSELINDKGFITIADVPTKTSQLTNDSNFLTQHQDLSNYATIDDLPSRTSQLTNDSGYVTRQYVDNVLNNLEIPNDGDNSGGTNVDLSVYATKEYVDNAIDEIDVTEQLGDYTLKTDIPIVPTVPTNISAFTNDKGYLTSIPSEYVTDGELNNKGYLTEHQNISHLATKDEIPTKVSELENDKGYLTSIPSEYVTDSELTTKGYATTNYVDDAVANLSELKMNIVNGLTFANAYINYNNGDYVSGGSAYACQEYIPVISGATYEVNGVSNIVRIAYYDSSKTYMNQYIDNTPTFNFTPPSNASYIRVHVDSTSNAWQNLSIESEMEDYIRAYINNATSGGSGNVDLSLYALKTDLHSHSNKTVIDTITSTMVTKWNQSIPFNDTYVSDCNTWLTNGYVKTGANQTSNLPSLCTGTDRWGILFFIAENVTQGTGTQMYFPIDGTYKGRIFTRSLTNMNQTPTVGEWNLVSISNVGTSSLTNPTISDVSASSLANESTMPTISDINISTNEGYLNGLLSKMEMLEEKIKTLEEKIKTLEEKE